MNQTNRWWIIVCLFFAAFFVADNKVYGQRYLYLEKKSVKRKHKFEPGQMITLQLRQDTIWRTYMITGMDFDHDVLRLEGQVVFLDSILAVKSPKTIIPSGIGKALMQSGISMGGVTILSELMFNPPNTKFFLITSAATILSGFSVKKLGKVRRTYRMGTRYNLRMVDTDIYIQKQPN